MIASAVTYAILAISGLIGSGIAAEEIRKANHQKQTTRPVSEPKVSQPAE